MEIKRIKNREDNLEGEQSKILNKHDGEHTLRDQDLL